MNKHTIEIPNEMEDELRPHYDVDYSRTRPNPYAGRAKATRRAALRARQATAAVERHVVTLPRADAKYLRSLDPSLSKAIRKLIAKAR